MNFEQYKSQALLSLMVRLACLFQLISSMSKHQFSSSEYCQTGIRYVAETLSQMVIMISTECLGFNANKWKSSNLSGRQKHEMPENLLNKLNPKYIWVGKNLMNILINYSMNIFSKITFPTFRNRISNRSWIFGALEHAEMYINDFLVWYFIFQRIF